MRYIDDHARWERGDPPVIAAASTDPEIGGALADIDPEITIEPQVGGASADLDPEVAPPSAGPEPILPDDLKFLLKLINRGAPIEKMNKMMDRKKIHQENWASSIAIVQTYVFPFLLDIWLLGERVGLFEK